MNNEKFWTNGTKALLEAKKFAYENAICTLEKFYYNFFEGETNFKDLDFEEVKNYLKCVLDDFETYDKINDLYIKFEEISKVE